MKINNEDLGLALLSLLLTFVGAAINEKKLERSVDKKLQQLVDKKTEEKE